jgi:hypothetical protein
MTKKILKSLGGEVSDSDFDDYDEDKFWGKYWDKYLTGHDKDDQWYENFRVFRDYSRMIHQAMVKDPDKKISELMDAFNNITQETKQLIEIKDIIDELKMILEIQEAQGKVLSDFAKALPDSHRDSQETMRQVARTVNHHCAEIAGLSKKAEVTQNAVRESTCFATLAF